MSKRKTKTDTAAESLSRLEGELQAAASEYAGNRTEGTRAELRRAAVAYTNSWSSRSSRDPR